MCIVGLHGKPCIPPIPVLIRTACSTSILLCEAYGRCRDDSTPKDRYVKSGATRESLIQVGQVRFEERYGNFSIWRASFDIGSLAGNAFAAEPARAR